MSLYIGMQPDETVAQATCGCCLYRSGDDAPNVDGAGTNDDPLMTICPLHDAAQDLLDAAKQTYRLLDAVMGNGIYEARIALAAAIAKAEGQSAYTVRS